MAECLPFELYLSDILSRLCINLKIWNTNTNVTEKRKDVPREA